MMQEYRFLKVLEDIEGCLVDVEMKSPKISIIEMDNLRNYISRVKKEILSQVFEGRPKIS